MDTTPTHPRGTIRVLFVCLGNICRSPAAHAVMQHMVDDAGLAGHITVDSAGIGGWHTGQLPDRRMREHGARRGYRIDHPARQFDARRDFRDFDVIVAMDDDNYHDLILKANTEDERGKVTRMANFLTCHPGHDSVPDPYYGGSGGFDLALDLIEDGCRALTDRLAALVTPQR